MVGLPVLVLVAFAVLERRARRREAEQDAPSGHETGDEQGTPVETGDE
jgi:hypothetical protein